MSEKVELREKLTTSAGETVESQKWIFDQNKTNIWGTIRHSKYTDLYLTTRYSDKSTILTLETKGIDF